MEPKPDRSTWGIVFATVLSLLSLMSFGMSVHTYCENRPVMIVLAMAGVWTCYFLIRQWPRTLWRTIAAALALLICLFQIAFNGWYFAWATRVCTQQSTLH